MEHDAEPTGEIVLYRTDDGRTRLACHFAAETLWLSQALMAELFQTTPQNVTQHLKAIYDEGELQPEATRKDFLQVRLEGARQVRRTVRQYNLDAILAVGYRVRSPRGTQFRIWATERLREYMVKGVTMDDERLRNPPVEGSGVPDYFDDPFKIDNVSCPRDAIEAVCDLSCGREICRTQNAWDSPKKVIVE